MKFYTWLDRAQSDLRQIQTVYPLSLLLAVKLSAAEVAVKTKNYTKNYLFKGLNKQLTYEPCHEKTCLRDFQPGKTQTGLLSYRDQLVFKFSFFVFSKYRYYTIQVANNKGADQTAEMRRLICAFVVRICHKQVFSWCGS